MDVQIYLFKFLLPRGHSRAFIAQLSASNLALQWVFLNVLIFVPDAEPNFHFQIIFGPTVFLWKAKSWSSLWKTLLWPNFPIPNDTLLVFSLVFKIIENDFEEIKWNPWDALNDRIKNIRSKNVSIRKHLVSLHKTHFFDQLAKLWCKTFISKPKKNQSQQRIRDKREHRIAASLYLNVYILALRQICCK